MIKHRTIVSIISILFLILFACSSNPADSVKRYAETYNTHNVKEIVSLYADDAVFEVVGKFSITGKKQITDITEYGSVLHSRMAVSNIEKRSNTAVLLQEWKNSIK